MSNVTGRMVVPGLFNFATIGVIASPVANYFDPAFGLPFASIAAVALTLTWFFSYTLTIRVPTAEEMKEWLDEQRD